MKCPIHNIPDCSPLLNGCSIVIHAHQNERNKVLAMLQWHEASSVVDVIGHVSTAWQVFRFTGKKATKAALYGRSRMLKTNGIDAMVRAFGPGYVLIARNY